MLKKLLLLSFIEGAAVMAAELAGARFMAPIFGSSLYVWASVMAITLGALAAGYFFGARISLKKDRLKKDLRLILLFASVFLILMPVIAHYLLPRISYLPFMPAVILSVITLLFLPVFLLGASSPLFIALQTNEIRDAGKTSGTVYAVSTAGGIVATFLCGFYFIPVLGLQLSSWLFGVLLFIVTAVVLRGSDVLMTILLLLFSYLNLQFYLGENGQINSDSILGRLNVSEEIREGDSVRVLKINDIIQTEMSLKNRKSVSAYVQLLDSLIPEASAGSRAVVLGLGGGLTANLLVRKRYNCEGVEFDDRIIESAEKYFFLDPQIRSYHQDARYFLNQCKNRYDVVLADLFKAEEQPSHVFTLESLSSLKKNLNPGAKIYITWHGYLHNKIGEGTRILLNTLKEAGYKTELYSFSSREDARNLVIVASAGEISEKRFLIAEQIEKTSLINSDDRPLLERYNAMANKAWRAQYLRYYQNR